MRYNFSQKFSFRQLAFVFVGVALYLTAFIMLHTFFEIRPVPLIILPMVALCWYWGTKRGLIAGTLIILSSIFSVVVFHLHAINPASGIAAIALTYALGSFAGWSRKLYDGEKKYSQMLSEERKALLKENEERRKAEDKALWNEYFLKTMTNSSPLGILAVNNDKDEVLYCNHRFCEIWNVEIYENKIAIKEIKSSEFVNLCHENLQDFDFYKKHFSPSLDLKSLDTATIDIKFKDGSIIRRFTAPIMGKSDEYLGRLFMYEDVTERKKSEYLVKRIYEYEHLIYTISNQFINASVENVDEVFNSSLKILSEFLGMDRGFFYNADPEARVAENLYEWRNNRVDKNLSKVLSIEAKTMPGFAEKFLNLEKVIVPDVESLPPEREMERAFLLKRGIKAFIVFPVLYQNSLLGFLGFSSQSPVQFPEDAAPALKIISDIFASAFLRKQKNEALLESEERFRLLVQHSADMITVVDRNGNLQYVSEAVGSILGYKAGERNGMPISRFTHPDDLNKISGTIEMLLNKKISSSSPQYIRVLNTNGTYVYLESIFTDQLDNPAINGIVINSRDFTQHLALQEALRNSRNFLNAVINSASDPMFVKDSNYKWVLVNDAFCRLTGYEREALLGKTAFDIFPDEEANNFMSSNQMVLNAEEMKDFEVRFTDSKNKKHIIVSNLSFYQEESGEKYLIANLRDETKRKELQEEINNALQKEKELNRLKSKFISMVSHEYRTPLTAILSSAELIELFGLDMEDNEKQEYLNNIKNSVDYLTSLLDDVLLINRAESGRMQFDPGQFELISFCKEIMKSMMDGIKCRIEFEAAFDSKNVLMDKKLLRHILMNLLSNAVKYSKEKATVWLTADQSDGQIIFEVKDKGIGIPYEDQGHLFEPFFRADNVSHIPGSGLGLSIVKNCVDLHNGNISFESVPGEGTKFLVSLPCESSTCED